MDTFNTSTAAELEHDEGIVKVALEMRAPSVQMQLAAWIQSVRTGAVEAARIAFVGPRCGCSRWSWHSRIALSFPHLRRD